MKMFTKPKKGICQNLQKYLINILNVLISPGVTNGYNYFLKASKARILGQQLNDLLINVSLNLIKCQMI